MKLAHHYALVITALGSDQIGILEIFTKLCKQCGCNILDSKLTTFGTECVFVLHVTGAWHAIAKLEAGLPALAKEFEYAIQSKRTSTKPLENIIPYQIQVIAEDKVGILHDLALFFTQYGMSVEQMECETYQIKNSAQLVNITLIIHVPVKKHIATLRERFMLFCEDRNFDATLEPYKN